MIPRLAPKLSGSRDPALKARAGRRTSGPKAVVGADIRTAHECSLWSNTSMGTAQLDPQRQCVTVTKWNAGRARRETVGAGRVSRIWAARRNHAPSLGSINTFLVGEWLPREPAESSEEPGESGPCDEASRRGRFRLRAARWVRASTLAAVLPISDIMSSQPSDESPTFQVTPFMACTTAPTRSPASPTRIQLSGVIESIS